MPAAGRAYNPLPLWLIGRRGHAQVAGQIPQVSARSGKPDTTGFLYIPPPVVLPARRTAPS